MPINSEHLASLTDADVIDQNGDKVGGVGQIYLDDATGQPAWASVKSGLFGLRESFVPLHTADAVEGKISVPFTKDFIKDAPRVDADNHLDDSQQASLYSYYGLERPTVAAAGGGAEETTTFSSEETAADLTAGRTEGLPTSPGDDIRDGAATTEYTTPGSTQESASPAVDDGNDLGSGGVSRDESLPSSGPHGDASPERAAAIGAAGAAGAGAAGAGPQGARDDVDGDSREPRPGDKDWDETHHATFQQENPAAQADWAAEQAPDEPISTTWSVPATEPADEEPTRVGRSGYSPDRPAAHSSAYEGHGGPPVATPAADAPVVDETTDEGAIYAADADAAGTGTGTGTGTGVGSDAGPSEVGSGDVDSRQFGSVEPVTADAADGPTDDAVTGAPGQTGTGYPGEASEGETPETSGVGVGGAMLGGAAAGGVAAAGVAATDTETTAYEVPGQEVGSPTTDAAPGAEFAADREEPFDGRTAPEDADSESAFAAGTDAGDTGAEADAGNEPETFGATGYRPDRDGSEMTDEERERLNQARGAL